MDRPNEGERPRIEGKSDKIKRWKADSAFYTLSGLKGVAIADEAAADLAKYGLDKPRFTFVATDEGGQELARILIGAESGTHYYAAKAGSQRVVEVEKSTIDDLPKKADDLIEAPPKPAAEATKSTANGN